MRLPQQMEMAEMGLPRIMFTVPGFSKPKAQALPPAPPPPEKPPSKPDVAQSRQRNDARRRASVQRGMAGAVRNKGGAAGLETADALTTKSLLGA